MHPLTSQQMSAVVFEWHYAGTSERETRVELAEVPRVAFSAPCHGIGTPSRHAAGFDVILAGTMSKRDAELDTQVAIQDLNAILEMELAGVCRYLHYSLMIFGHGRIPIIKWMRDQATEGMDHAALAGEHVTTLGGHPSLKIGKLTESHKHDTEQILREALEHEHATLDHYYSLLTHVEGRSVWLEEFARDQIRLEEGHIAEVEKMLRRPGDLSPAR